MKISYFKIMIFIQEFNSILHYQLIKICLQQIIQSNQITFFLMSAENFKYPECQKGDCHIGEILNLVCVEPKCIQKSIICGICYDEEHKGHKIKPLKVIINSSKKYLQGLTPMNIDIDKVKTSVAETRGKLISKFDEFQKYVNDSLSSIRDSINAIFIKVVDQIELKTGRNDELLKALQEIKSKEMQYDHFITLMQKLLAGVPLDTEEEESELSGKQIEDAVVRIQTKVEKDLKVKQQKIKTQIDGFLQTLQKTADNPSIFQSKPEYHFSTQLKHSGVSVINENTIKSIEGYNYHFALMEPSIHEKGDKPFKVSFKIKENISNWLAVGICYKNVIQAGNYTFNYSTLGHGAYLISSNGGSWSSIDSAKNNTVNAFSYYKNDTIIVQYQPDELKVVFRKEGTEQSHTIEYEVKEDDELCLCALFYYKDDEIEFLGYSN